MDSNKNKQYKLFMETLFDWVFEREKKESISLLEKLIQGYERSKVNVEYHYDTLSLAYINLSVVYEEDDKPKEALKQVDKAVKFSLKCKKGENLWYLFSLKAYILDRVKRNDSESKLKYRGSYQLMKLMKNSKRDKNGLEEKFKKWYGEEIECY